MDKAIAPLSLTIMLSLLLGACSTRDLQDNLSGSTAQRLLSHSIDDLVVQLPEELFKSLSGQDVFLDSYFIDNSDIKHYADERLKLELINRFNINVVDEASPGGKVLSVFYTSLATDRDNFGISIPLGYVPGFNESTQLNIISLEKFHGISEMYYFVGEVGKQLRGETLQAVVKTDALGLPFITIPISNMDRAD